MRSLVSNTVDQSPIALGSSASYSPATLKAPSSNSDLTSTGTGGGKNKESHWYTIISPQLEDIQARCWPSSEMSARLYDKKLGRQPGDDVPEIDVSAMIWRICMSMIMKGAGQDYLENLRTTWKSDFEKAKQFLQKLILNQSEDIFGISTIDWNAIPWIRHSLLHDRAVQLSKAEVHVFSDSALCLCRIHEFPRSIEVWMEEGEWFTKSHDVRELDCVDGEPLKFEWKNSQDSQHCSCFERSKGRWRGTECSWNSSKIESSPCRCVTTSIGEKQDTKKLVFPIPQKLRRTQKYSPKDIGHSSDHDQKYSPKAAEMVMINLTESGHPICRGAGKTSIHYNGDSATAELLFRTIVRTL